MLRRIFNQACYRIRIFFLNLPIRMQAYFCKHRDRDFIRNIYGDEINLVDARSMWRCNGCGRYILQCRLHRTGKS